MIKPHKLQGVFVDGRQRLYTRNFVPGTTVYGEKLVHEKGVEYREWDIRRSKLAAALAKGVSQVGIKPDNRVLYLGCASGTTASHVSDMVGKQGFVFALDFAPRVVRDMVLVCEQRENMTALLADANQPQTYVHRLLEVDAVFQDIAQKNQVEIFLKNCNLFLKKDGFGVLTIKARSIAVQDKPSKVFKQVRQELEEHCIVVDCKNLEPFERDHCLFVVKMKE